MQQNTKSKNDIKVVTQENTQRSEQDTDNQVQIYNSDNLEASLSFKSCISHRSDNIIEDSELLDLKKHDDSTDEVKFESESEQNSIANKESPHKRLSESKPNKIFR